MIETDAAVKNVIDYIFVHLKSTYRKRCSGIETEIYNQTFTFAILESAQQEKAILDKVRLFEMFVNKSVLQLKHFHFSKFTSLYN